MQSAQTNWQLKTFQQLDTNELYDILKLRVDVFVVEQTCYYPELDNLDRLPQTLHLFNYSNNLPNAYLRILPLGAVYSDAISIGRVVVAPAARTSGLGHQLMAQALIYCQRYFANEKIRISAQAHLNEFYQQHGFVTVSDIYLEDNIAHIRMERAAQS